MTPCDWPIEYATCEGDTCVHMESLDPAVVTAIEGMAVTWLWEATRRRFGNCPVTLLPCLNGCHNNYGQPWGVYRIPGSTSWVNMGCGSCSGTCSCGSVSQVILPTKGAVVEVRIDGEIVPADDWKVLSNKYLLRTDGGSWPQCQDLAADPPTWEVDFVPGFPVPAMGPILTGQLACNLARRFCGQGCELPANTTAVTRQGVSILIEPGEATGIWVIDQWVTMMNQAVARVWSPDVRVVHTVEAMTSV